MTSADHGMAKLGGEDQFLATLDEMNRRLEAGLPVFTTSVDAVIGEIGAQPMSGGALSFAVEECGKQSFPGRMGDIVNEGAGI